jgi:hypothetical protein
VINAISKAIFRFMLPLFDMLLSAAHFIIIGFNLFGWIWPQTRKLHLACIILTAASWFILGLKYGIGYCPITDIQWRIKEQLGEHNLPPSFITYYANKITGEIFSDSFINAVTGICFASAAILSFYFNFFHKRPRRKLTMG